MFLAERFAEPLAALNLSNKRLPDDFDLISEGVIDSFGIIELHSRVIVTADAHEHSRAAPG